MAKPKQNQWFIGSSYVIKATEPMYEGEIVLDEAESDRSSEWQSVLAADATAPQTVVKVTRSTTHNNLAPASQDAASAVSSTSDSQSSVSSA